VVGAEVAAVRAAADTSGTVAERLVAVIETFTGRALKAPRLAYALLAEPVDPVIEQLRLEFRAEFRDVLAALVTVGVRSGELPPQDASVVAAALVGAISTGMAGMLAGETDDDPVPPLVVFALRAVGVVRGRGA
jgi:AcrR family transcriptional regulator